MAGQTTASNSDGISTRLLTVSGTASLDNGNVTTDGAGNITAVSITSSVPAAGTVSGTSPAPSGTLATSSALMRFTPTGAVGSLNLALGTKNGQFVTIENNSTVVANTMTFPTGGNILVDASSDSIVIKAASAEMFVFDLALNSGAGLWVHVGPFAG